MALGDDAAAPPRDGAAPAAAANLGDGPMPGGTGVSRWKALIDKAAGITGVPARLLAAVMQQESGGDPSAGRQRGPRASCN